MGFTSSENSTFWYEGYILIFFDYCRCVNGSKTAVCRFRMELIILFAYNCFRRRVISDSEGEEQKEDEEEGATETMALSRHLSSPLTLSSNANSAVKWWFGATTKRKNRTYNPSDCPPVSSSSYLVVDFSLVTM